MLNYKSKVGPEKDYKKAGVIQLYNLIEMGLEPHHKLCDFGCGSLRLGMYAIQYLDKGNYHGMDPNVELIRKGLNENNLEHDKRNSAWFHISDKCDIDNFLTEFDFIIAQSIFTHLPFSKTIKSLNSAHKSLKKDGTFLVTIWEGKSNYQGEEWVDTCVSYKHNFFVKLCETNGFIATKVDLKHWVNLSWYRLVKK